MENKNEKKKNNTFKLNKENIRRSELEKIKNENNLYPELDDPNFSLKIAAKKEFNNSKMNHKIYTDIEDFKNHADSVCFQDYEIAQHQKFVKNFISFQTPYNSLLLFHGLGSGKTCSAIGVSEQIRKYMGQMGFNKRIIVVASPNVQKNFKLQLFDEKKLEEKNGIFSLNNCTGDKILKEVNPTYSKGLTRSDIVRMINNLISKKYVFMGYTQFSNYIDKKLEVPSSSKNKEKLRLKLLKETFDNRLVIIDEVHNIRLSNDNKLKKISSSLFKIASNSENFKMLLLSATPLYNNYKEIVWLLNLMNANDKRSLTNIKDIFDSNGDFLISDDGEEVGKMNLMQKATGYVSYVRGENPYSFPFRIFPMNFNLLKSSKNPNFVYPNTLVNGRRLIEKLEHIDVYLTNIGDYQEKVYNMLLEELKNDKENDGEELFDSNEIESFGYTKLTEPIESLNIVYPTIVDEITDPKECIGSKGLQNIFRYKEVTQSSEPYITNFEYKKEIEDKYGRIFTLDKIGLYSGKIKEICENIKSSEGISVIYSQYIDAGVIPMALALEEMGYVRYGSKNLFNDEYRKKNKIYKLDSLTNQYENEMKNKKDFIPSSYMMITGRKTLSNNWLEEFKTAVDVSNTNGEKIKVIIITRTGSEGLDFSNIRGVHIMEPWYNMNRIEQIIGRAIRFCSHKRLKFEKRNASIFMYASLGEDLQKETADLYVYRLAEKKSKKIGNVTRVLKEVAADCILNISQTNFSFQNFDNLTIDQNIFNKENIKYQIGDKPYSAMCDYKDTCEFKCKSKFESEGIKELDTKIEKINFSTYNEEFLSSNSSLIIQKIKKLFRSKYIYNKNDIIGEIKATTNYGFEEILFALNQIIEDDNDIFVDGFDRLGKVINIGELYLFQPIEIINKEISLHDRMTPVNFKNETIRIKLKDDLIKKEDLKSENNVYDKLSSDYLSIFDYKNTESQFSFAIRELLEIFKVNREKVKLILVHHLFDFLNIKDKVKITEYLLNLKEFDSELQEIIFDYIKNLKVENNILSGYIFENKSKYDLYLIKDDGEKKYLIKAKQGEINNLLNVIKKKFLFTSEEFNTIFAKKIGVIMNFNNKSINKQEKLFKIKNIEGERNTSARCDQYTKQQKIALLNELTPNIDGLIESYTNSNLKKIPLDTCNLIEFIFRYLDLEGKGDKRWFLNSEYSILNKLEKRIKL